MFKKRQESAEQQDEQQDEVEQQQQEQQQPAGDKPVPRTATEDPQHPLHHLRDV